MVFNEDRKSINGLLLVHLPDGPTAHFKLSNLVLGRDIKVRGGATQGRAWRASWRGRGAENLPWRGALPFSPPFGAALLAPPRLRRGRGPLTPAAPPLAPVPGPLPRGKPPAQLTSLTPTPALAAVSRALAPARRRAPPPSRPPPPPAPRRPRQGHGRATSHRPELILNNFDTRLGRRLGRMVASLFHQDPQFRGRRAVTFHNQRDFIFFRWGRRRAPGGGRGRWAGRRVRARGPSWAARELRFAWRLGVVHGVFVIPRLARRPGAGRPCRHGRRLTLLPPPPKPR
jgi:rRNA maturation protein Rpf1